MTSWDDHNCGSPLFPQNSSQTYDLHLRAASRARLNVRLHVSMPDYERHLQRSFSALVLNFHKTDPISETIIAIYLKLAIYI